MAGSAPCASGDAARSTSGRDGRATMQRFRIAELRLAERASSARGRGVYRVLRYRVLDRAASHRRAVAIEVAICDTMAQELASAQFLPTSDVMPAPGLPMDPPVGSKRRSPSPHSDELDNEPLIPLMLSLIHI